MPATPDKQPTAPEYSVPAVPVVSVEHPCMVQNVDKAIRMLGGDSEIVQTLRQYNDRPLGLRFEPDDPTSRQVLSYNKKSANLLLKVTVPRRTGRKRKRGTGDDFKADPTGPPGRKDAKHLLRSFEDNQQRCQVEVVGPITSTHVWRAMPDFVYSAAGSRVLNEVGSKIVPKSYPGLKEWSLPRPAAVAAQDPDAIPPFILSTQALPQNYAFRQARSERRGLTMHSAQNTAGEENKPQEEPEQQEDRLNASAQLGSAPPVQIIGTQKPAG
jgi:general transcription factor 3C polypeptide 5 (transcription factor C subunit 1)